ncbi:tail fiber assembly protein [Halomonas rhizosphaerae]|uniref:DUF4376 domain-containing protein n=1 Tax=Halomonas rhizosphaerae TaxID=3043296 RepID=A0ABT6V5M3_9GAMM|nr:DUF4376 domain-containing protein [Halomonas rhizosphaerae]MDI5893075.1 DUF4376 domain-containing protein [Halomonas rhizosphaerae]
MHYSATQNAFYSSKLIAEYQRAGTWPSDAIKATAEEYETYGKGSPPAGMRRGANENGRPAWMTIPPIDLETLAARQRREIDTARDAAFAAGMPFTFHDGSEDVVQTRPEDKSNLLGIAIEARDLRDAGVADPVIEFRAASNTTYAITPTKAIEMTNAALAHVKAIYDQSWQRKDAIKSALEAEEREGIETVVW